MITKWQTLEEFEEAPEDGIYFVYTKIRDIEEIEIAWYFNDQFHSDPEGMFGIWWITHVMKITLPNPPNNA